MQEEKDRHGFFLSFRYETEAEGGWNDWHNAYGKINTWTLCIEWSIKRKRERKKESTKGESEGRVERGDEKKRGLHFFTFLSSLRYFPVCPLLDDWNCRRCLCEATQSAYFEGTVEKSSISKFFSHCYAIFTLFSSFLIISSVTHLSGIHCRREKNYFSPIPEMRCRKVSV